jgi:glucose-6-phosphate 1-dehydrogenase
VTVDPHLFVIFGATGDLATRRLFPALHRVVGDEIPAMVLGVATRSLDDAGLQERAATALQEAGVGEAEARDWAEARVRYMRSDPDDGPAGLRSRIEELEKDHDLPGNRVFYLALPPHAFTPTIEALGSVGLAEGRGWTRLVVEKPFGQDLDSARQLNAIVHQHFDEVQVYRIDHYLGKETVQNLLVFRFTNPVFEASWNRDRVERVEITVAEEIDVEGRGRFYDLTGAIGDMMQSHLTQVLALVAMEPPATMHADSIRDEKLKVLRSIRGIPERAVVLGQYDAGVVDGEDVPGYRDVEGVADDSTMPTYAAIRLWIDNWRWQGIPFLLRTGKAMARRVTEIVVIFRGPPVCLFHDAPDDCVTHADVLRLTLQPDEGFSLEIEVKDPDTADGLRTVPLRFSYADAFGPIPEAYDTLIADILEGDQTLFVRGDETEASWRLFDPVLAYDLPLHRYEAGTWGPPEADGLLGPRHSWATGDRT